mgnify:CR=1 FL=1
MNITNRFGTRTRKILKFVLFAGIVCGLGEFSDPLSSIYLICTTLVVLATAFQNVSSNHSVSRYLFFANVIFIQLSTYSYLSSQSWWFSFFGTEFVISVFIGIVVILAVNLVAILIVGSVVYGNLERYSEEMDKRKMEVMDDPYGDKHAQKILKETNSDP